MTLIIGLTGGIASGKSTVSNMFKEMGIPVIDADVEARLAVQRGEPAYEKIKEVFGKDILLPNGEIDRPKLGRVIFHNEDKRLSLNRIVHPEVRKRMTAQIDEAKNQQKEMIVLDIPLLFESKLPYMVDKVLLVYVDKAAQLERLMTRNQLAREDAEARIQSQMLLSEKVKLADAVIDNNGTILETKKQLDEILSNWKNERAEKEE